MYICEDSQSFVLNNFFIFEQIMIFFSPQDYIVAETTKTQTLS